MHGVLTLSQAKQDFQRGFLKGYRIERMLMSPGWTIILRSLGDDCALADAREREVRVFKSLDSAVSALESIGFKVDQLK